MAPTTWQPGIRLAVIGLTLGCSAAPPSTPPSGPSYPQASVAADSHVPPARSAAPPVSIPTAVASPPAVDPCALSEPRLVVRRQGLIRCFDVARDGRLVWARFDAMTRETHVLGVDPTVAEAEPEPIARVKMYGDPDELVVGRDGFWLGVDDDSRGLCGSRVMWWGRDAIRPVPVSSPACVFGPAPTAGEAEAVWATSKTYTHAKHVVVAEGRPPKGLAPIPGAFDGRFEAVAHASDGTFFALDNGEVIRRGADGVTERVVPPVHRFPAIQSWALAVQGDEVYLASSGGRHKVDVFRIPRREGKRTLLDTFDAPNSVIRLRASDNGVVVQLSGDRSPDRLHLIDPRERCPTVELPRPKRPSRVRVAGDVVYILSDEGIVAVSFAARQRGRE